MLRSKRSKPRDGGQALVEFALLAPLLVILIFGFTDIARMYNAWVTIQGAAREGARYGVTGQTDCTAYTGNRLACIQYEAQQRANALTNDEDDIAVTVKSWDYPAYTTQTANNAGNPCDAIEVQVDYTFTPSTPLASTFLGNLNLVASERLVNEPFGTCE
jgi:Flp pilus assembly protein TadG